jgi:hypothetical protein
MLANDNILICEGTSGRFFEINTVGDKVWEYINPVGATKIYSQGEIPKGNTVFRALKYGIDYPAFDGKNLIPGNTIESGTTTNCSPLSTQTLALSLKLYPNPIQKNLYIQSFENISKVEIYNLLGKRVYSIANQNIKTLDLNELNSGIYVIKMYTSVDTIFKKIVKK